MVMGGRTNNSDTRDQPHVSQLELINTFKYDPRHINIYDMYEAYKWDVHKINYELL